MDTQLTVVLLNWKRPENLRRIIEALGSQTASPFLWLWDNSGEGFTHPSLSWTIHSSENRGCIPRWYMAQEAVTPYVMTWDDDLMPTDRYLLRDLLDEYQVLDDPLNRIVGPFGKVLTPELNYERCPSPMPGHKCDIVLGRVMLMKTSSIRGLSLGLSRARAETERMITDDIMISALLAQGRKRFHRRTILFHNRYEELPDDHAVCKEPGHFLRREAARRYWFA